MKIVCCGLVFALLAGVGFGAEKPATSPAEELIQKAKEAFRNRKRDEAVQLANQAVELSPTNFNAVLFRAELYARIRKPREAIVDFNRALQLDPKAIGVHQERGGEHFKLGEVKEAIADFDKFLEAAPQQTAYHWQRGIAYYYADKFEEGRKQFELHQTVNANDVENAVWHYLCVAKSKDTNAARAALLPIKEDARVPMMEIYALYAGKGTPEAVLEAANKSNRDAQFYAHLYLALFYAAQNNPEKERAHILKATEDFAMDHYMGDVARVHKMLRAPRKS
jgi:lipoprotein NlpI